jgi:serine/threonine protein kinase
MLSRAGVTEAGDVYQIGVVLYEMLVGIPPYYNENIQKLYENIQKGKLKIPKYLSKPAKNILVVSSALIFDFLESFMLRS